jgi:hypothetical protein
LNLISQRKSVSTPNISNGEPVFSVSSTEQASSAESLVSSSRPTDHTIDVKFLCRSAKFLMNIYMSAFFE